MTPATAAVTSGEVPIGMLPPDTSLIGREPPEPIAGHGIWLKSHLYREGPYLVGRTYMVAAGKPEIFTVKVDLRPIARAVLRYHAKLHGKALGEDLLDRVGCPGCPSVGDILSEVTPGTTQAIVGWFPKDTFKSAVRAVKKIGRSKVVKTIARTAKSVVKSKITGAIVTGAAVVFPPVGAPALAAYGAANAGLAAYERGRAIARTADKTLKNVKVYRRLKRTIKRKVIGRPKRVRVRIRARGRVVTKRLGFSSLARLMAKKAARYSRSPDPKTRTRGLRLRQAVKRASAKRKAKIRARVRTIPRRIRPRVRDAIKRGRKAKKIQKAISRNRKPLVKSIKTKKKVQRELKRIAVMARYAQKPGARLRAKKIARILKLVGQNRQRLRDIAARRDPRLRKGETGLVIDQRGRILPGRYVAEAGAPGAGVQLMLAAKGKMKPGHFRRVGACVGC